MAPSARQLQLARTFKEFDADGNGYIDVSELQAALSRAGKRVTKGECESILRQFLEVYADSHVACLSQSGYGGIYVTTILPRRVSSLSPRAAARLE